MSFALAGEGKISRCCIGEALSLFSVFFFLVASFDAIISMCAHTISYAGSLEQWELLLVLQRALQTAGMVWTADGHCGGRTGSVICHYEGQVDCRNFGQPTWDQLGLNLDTGKDQKHCKTW